MRRFAKSYLTIAAVIIMLANLMLIILYGRQFQASELTDCLSSICDRPSLTGDLIIANLILVGVLFMIWFGLTRLHAVKPDLDLTSQDRIW